MFKTSKRKWLALGIIFLSALNIAAVYVLSRSIADRSLISHANPEMKQSLQQKELWSDVFTSAVFTIDIFCILILLYFLIKMLIRKMKSSTTKS